MKKSHRRKTDRFRGSRFTIIELLIVVAIIAILAGMLLPALNKARERAKTISCVNSMKELALAGVQYAGDYDYLPLANNGTISGEKGRPQHILVEHKYLDKNILKKGCAVPRKPITSCTAATYMDSVWASPFFYNGFFGAITSTGAISTAPKVACNPVKLGKVVSPGHKTMWGDNKRWDAMTLVYLKSKVSPILDNDADWPVAYYCHDLRINMGFVDGHAATISHADIGKIHADNSWNVTTSTQYWLDPNWR